MAPSYSNRRGRPFVQHMSLTGDGNGVTTAIGNYATPTDFYITPQNEKEVLNLIRLSLHVEDVGAVDSGAWGNNITLTNGIAIKLEEDHGATLVSDLTSGENIKTTGQLSHYFCELNEYSFGAGNTYVSAIWSFLTCFGEPIELRYGERLTITLEDDFTDLVHQDFIVAGVDVSDRDD